MASKLEFNISKHMMLTSIIYVLVKQTIILCVQRFLKL